MEAWKQYPLVSLYSFKLSHWQRHSIRYTPTHTYVCSASSPQVIERWLNCLSSQLTLKAIEKVREAWLKEEQVSREKTNCLIFWASVKWTLGYTEVVEDSVMHTDSQPLIRAVSTVRLWLRIRDKGWMALSRFDNCDTVLIAKRYPF